MEARMLRIAVKLDRPVDGAHDGGEVDELSARHVVHGQFALLIGELLTLRAVPTDFDAMPTENETFFGRQDFFMGLVRRGLAVPDVALLGEVGPVRDAIKAE